MLKTLRWFDSKDLQTCFKLIHMLLVMGGDFMSRVKMFLNEVIINKMVVFMTVVRVFVMYTRR